MSTVASYPHVQIGVKDKSIYIPIATEDLPLHKPLYMMKCQKGPVGVPVWCPSYSDAKKTFGVDTFNKRSDYFSEQAYFLLQTFAYNGAFIMRVCDSNAKPSEVSIELGVSLNAVDVPLWQRDANGRFVLNLDGSKIPINDSGTECAYLYNYTAVAAGTAFDSAKTYFRKNASGNYVAVDTSSWGTTVPSDSNTYYLCDGEDLAKYARVTETVAIAGRTYYKRTTNYDYAVVLPTDRRIINTSYFKGATVANTGTIDLIANTTEYVLTSDTKFVTGKTYFKRAEAYKACLTSGTAATGYSYATGGSVPSNAIYELSGSTYVLTEDTTFSASKTYYVRNGYTYTSQSVTVGDTVTADTYYEYASPDKSKLYFLVTEKGTKLTNGATGVTLSPTDVVKQFDATTGTYTTIDVDDTASPWTKDADAGTYTVPATGTFYKVDNTSGTEILQVEPKFGLSAWGTTTPSQYLVFVKFASYNQASDNQLPILATGNIYGDQFKYDDDTTDANIRAIDESKFMVYAASTTGHYTTTASCVGTYVFTSKISSTPYTYTAESFPEGASLVNAGALYYIAGYSFSEANREAQAKISGHKLAWRAIVRDATTDGRVFGSAETKDSDNFKWYPMFDIVADNPGEWGKAFGFKFYYDKTKNTLNTTIANKAVTISMSPQQLVSGDTTPTAIVDAYASDTVTGVLRPDTIDETTELDITLGKRVDRAYTGNYALPCTIHYYPGNFEIIGRILMADEIAARKTLEGYYSIEGSALETIKDDNDESLGLETFVDRLFEKTATTDDINDTDTLAGYMANVLSCVDSDNIPYFTSCIVGGDDTLITDDTLLSATAKKSVFVPSSETTTYMLGGSDGEKNDWDIERFIRAQITAAENNTQEYLIDYMRCPYNSIIDTGVSLTTKKSYLDFMNIRDNMVVNLSTQSTWKYLVNNEEMTPSVNSRMDDESIGSSLRSYAWLMREDIANGTEACRCNIFLHAGKTSDHDGWVPETLWIAIKKASYLNLDYINKEAKELPNSSVDCFTELSWVAAAEDTKARCWNNGLNYVQYYNMTKVHHASVRTVYRYDTSILSDAGVTDALTFMKDHIRQSWARWAGSTRKAAELNARITEDLNKRYQYMLNGKYDFTVSVYQTDEDVKLGYVRHVDVELIAPGQNRVWLATVICKREGYEPEE